MKKVSLLTLALSMTAAGVATAQAPVSNPCPCPKAFQGFFAGGNTGYGIGSDQSNASSTQIAPNPTSKQLLFKNNLGIQGFDGGLNVGYTHRFNNFALGAEAVFNWASSKGKLYISTTGAFKRQLENSIQVRGNFSYIICNLVAPKIILGWDTSEWKRTTVFNAGSGPIVNASTKKRLNGFLWGAGVDFLLAKHVIAGLEYTGVASGSKSFNNTATYTPIGSNTTTTTVSGKDKIIYNKFALTVKFIY